MANYYAIIPARDGAPVEVLWGPESTATMAYNVGQGHLRGEGRLSPDTLQAMLVVPASKLAEHSLTPEGAAAAIVAFRPEHERRVAMLGPERDVDQASAHYLRVLKATTRQAHGLPYNHADLGDINEARAARMNTENALQLAAMTYAQQAGAAVVAEPAILVEARRIVDHLTLVHGAWKAKDATLGPKWRAQYALDAQYTFSDQAKRLKAMRDAAQAEGALDQVSAIEALRAALVPLYREINAAIVATPF